MITASLICRDSAKTIQACIESLKPVDYINITDTGSVDNTIDLIHKTCKAIGKPYNLTTFKWIEDFSAARNYNFSHIPVETDFTLWLDSDDTIVGIEKAADLLLKLKPDIGAVWLPYVYARDEYGNICTTFIRERFLRNSCHWIWRSIVHETVEPLIPCKFVREDSIVLEHHHDNRPRSARNMSLLHKLSLFEPGNKRVWLYMGHQNFADGNNEEAAKWYVKFAQDDTIPIERYQAYTYAARAYRNLNDWQQAIQADLMALELYPDWKDAMVGLSMDYLQGNELARCIQWGEKALSALEAEMLIFINPLDYTFNLLVTLAEAHRRQNNFSKAQSCWQRAYAIRPVTELQQTMDFHRQLSIREEVLRGIKALAVALLDGGEKAKLVKLTEIVPFWAKDLPVYKELTDGTTFHVKDLTDSPDVILEGNNALINLDKSLNPEALLEKHDTCQEVTLISSMPHGDPLQARVYSQLEMEQLVTSKPGRHLVDLHKEADRLVCKYDHKLPTNLLVRMFVGEGLEYWNPATMMKEGTGGSELAAAWVMRSLASKDCQPLLYTMDNQIWDGVIYRQWQNCNFSDPPCHLFISSRVPEVFLNEVAARQKWLWMHDIHCWNRFTPEVAERIDAIVCLSQWHAEHIKRAYPWLADCEVIDLDGNTKLYDDCWTPQVFFPEGRLSHKPVIAIIGDGVDVRRYENLGETKHPHRFVWTSSADRGLKELLQMWPKLKAALPDAELKIYYGWNYYDKSLHIPGQKKLKAEVLQLAKQEGVEWCGRIGQEDFPKHLARAGIWLYPPHSFRETYCISGLEMQLSRVLCFYRANGALGETIGNRGVMLPMDASPDTIVSTIARTLQDTERCATMLDEGVGYARQKDWNTRVDEMLALYTLLEKRSAEN